MKSIRIITAVLLTIVMLLTALPMTAFAATSGDFEYEILADGTVEITGYHGTGGDVTIPSEIDGHPITSIGYWAFSYCVALTSIVIPDNVTTIGYGAFAYCYDLTSVEIPDSVTTIGDSAFSGCHDLTSIEIPDSITTIGDSAFSGCSALTTVKIGNSVTTIGDSAFQSCKELPSVVIPDSVITIGDQAFYSCEALATVEIGDSVRSIGGYAFSGTGYYNQEANWENGVLYIGNHCIEAKSVSKHTVREGTITIADSAFHWCNTLTKIVIPNSVTSIGDHAFMGCDTLTTVYYTGSEDEWKTIEIDSNNDDLVLAEKIYFAMVSVDGFYCQLKADQTVKLVDYIGIDSSIQIPSVIQGYSVSEIGDFVFRDYDNIQTIVIPDSVITIGDSAFDGCSALIAIEIPDSVTTIGDSAFDGCSALIAIEIPDSVTTIGDSAFDGCSTLTSIDLPDSVRSIGSSAFYNTGYYNQESNWEDGVLYIGNHCIDVKSDRIPEKYTIREGTITVADNAFYGCVSLTEVVIPDSVITIGDSAFEDCYDLTEVVIPDSVQLVGSLALADTGYYNRVFNWDYGVLYCGNHCIDVKLSQIPSKYTIREGTITIADNAFYGCTALTEVVIPDSVTIVGDGAFDYCDYLRTVYYVGTKEQRANMRIGSANEDLLLANWFCNGELVAPIDPAFTLGDVDGDGKITSADARLALRAAVKLETLDEAKTKAADVDKDNQITTSDARKILRVAVKLDSFDA